MLPFIILFLNTTNLFADIGSRGRLDNNGDSKFSMILMAITAIGLGGFFVYLFITEGIKNNFNDKGFNKFGCTSIVVAIIGLLLVSMCSH